MDPVDRQDATSTNDKEEEQEQANVGDPDTGEDIKENEEVVTQQPKGIEANDEEDDDDVDGNIKSAFRRESGGGGIECTPCGKKSCVSASAGVGSLSKDYRDGLTNLELVGPNVGCALGCNGFPTLDCTLELGSVNLLCGVIIGTLGLAFNTKLKYTDDGCQGEMCGTGLDTSEGFTLSALGSKIGIVDLKKRKKKRAKKKKMWQKKKKKQEEDAGDEDEDEEVNDEEVDIDDADDDDEDDHESSDGGSD